MDNMQPEPIYQLVTLPQVRARDVKKHELSLIVLCRFGREMVDDKSNCFQ